MLFLIFICMATVQDIVDRLRIELNDNQKVEYTDEELVNYINSAIHYLWTFLIAMRHPITVKEVDFVNSVQLTDMERVYYVLVNDKITRKWSVNWSTKEITLSEGGSGTVVYATKPPRVSGLTDTFDDLLEFPVITVARIFAKNRLQFPVSQQDAIEIKQVLATLGRTA